MSFKGKRIPIQDVIPNSTSKEYIEQVTEIRTTDKQEFDAGHKNLIDCYLVQRDDPKKGSYLVQNIAQDPQLLNSALMDKLHGKIADKYLETIGTDILEMNKKEFESCLEDISSQIHDTWLEENKDWAPEEQKVTYSQLPEKEKEKDRRIANAIFETTQEVRTLETLKGIEIESNFKPISKPNSENIKKVSGWIKNINECQKQLIESPWHQEASKTLDKIKNSMATEIYEIAYKEFKNSLSTSPTKTQTITSPKEMPTNKPKKLEYGPKITM